MHFVGVHAAFAVTDHKNCSGLVYFRNIVLVRHPLPRLIAASNDSNDFKLGRALVVYDKLADVDILGASDRNPEVVVDVSHRASQRLAR
jgi:hypothetical protein